MFPKLLEVVEHEGLSFWITQNGSIGTGFEISICDFETTDAEDHFEKWTNVLRSLDSQVLARIEYKILERDHLDGNFPRSEAMSRIRFRDRRVLLFLESKTHLTPASLLKSIFKMRDFMPRELNFDMLVKVKEQFEHNGLSVEPISGPLASSLFNYVNCDWVTGGNSICDGDEFHGVVRLTKMTANPISPDEIHRLISALPAPFDICVSFKPIPEAKGKIWLEQRLRQLSGSSQVAEQTQWAATADAVEESLHSGARLLDFEYQIKLSRSSERDLSQDLARVRSICEKIGSCTIETFGAVPSFIATLPGAEQHVVLREFDDKLPAILPLWTKGTTKLQNKIRDQRSLTLHRADRTLHHFDLFDSSFEAFNVLIQGTTGKGKSVFTGLLTRALLADSKTEVIKVDVGGSHSKECEMYHGREVALRIGSPSGLNPFSIIQNQVLSAQEKTSVLSAFLAPLLKEQNEAALSKQLTSEIEGSLSKYIDRVPANPSLNDFYKTNATIPRKDLLRRWTEDGVYANAFADTSLAESKERLKYYNFAEVFQAADPEFAQAGFAAVLAHFSASVLCEKEKRIVFICEEVPFFIKSCFGALKLASANVRKLGHALVLIAQNSTDFIVNGDEGLIGNAPQRFLFSIDGDPEDFSKRFQLSDEELSAIQNLKTSPGRFSETFFQSRENGRTLRIEVTAEEYWALTSSKSDQLKIQKLRSALPELSIQDAIKCLSMC